jgi:ankyrin repeat protein
MSYLNIVEVSRDGRLDLVKDLIAAGANVNYRDWAGNTALLYAIRFSHNTHDKYSKIVRELIKVGADVTIADRTGTTALMLLTERGYIDIVLELIKVSNNVNFDSILTIAASKGYLEVIRELLKHVDITLRNNNGKNALMLASENGHLDIVCELLDHCNKLFQILEVPNELVDIIRSYYNYVNLQDKCGNTALIKASEGGHLGIVQELLKHGADVNIQNHTGRTAIIMCSITSHSFWYSFGYNTNESKIEIIKLLIKAGANLKICDNHGHNMLHIATIFGNSTIVKIIKQHLNQ